MERISFSGTADVIASEARALFHCVKRAGQKIELKNREKESHQQEQEKEKEHHLKLWVPDMLEASRSATLHKRLS